MPTILAYAMEVLNVLPGLISAGTDVYDLVEQTNADLKAMQATGTEPTDAQWDALHSIIDDLRAQRPDIA